MTRPTIHLNGTSAASLREQFLEAHRAINEALEAMSQASPNGRDYYPQGNAALEAAITEHRERCAALERVAQEYLELAMHADAHDKGR